MWNVKCERESYPCSSEWLYIHTHLQVTLIGLSGLWLENMVLGGVCHRREGSRGWGEVGSDYRKYIVYMYGVLKEWMKYFLKTIYKKYFVASFWIDLIFLKIYTSLCNIHTIHCLHLHYPFLYVINSTIRFYSQCVFERLSIYSS